MSKIKALCPNCHEELDEIFVTEVEEVLKVREVKYCSPDGYIEYGSVLKEYPDDDPGLVEAECPHCGSTIAESWEEIEKLRSPLKSAVKSQTGGDRK